MQINLNINSHAVGKTIEVRSWLEKLEMEAPRRAFREMLAENYAYFDLLISEFYIHSEKPEINHTSTSKNKNAQNRVRLMMLEQA